MSSREIIAIGASAGGIEPLLALVRAMPANFPAALFVVLHVPPHGPSVLPQLLSRAGILRARHPEHGEAIEDGVIYVAPPDRHLLVRPGHVHLGRGPSENGHRPAV